MLGDDFSKVVTDIGTADADNFDSGPEANIIVAGQDDDFISGGGGRDVLRGGQGNDTIVIHDQDFQRVAGGNGVDTLRIEFAIADLSESPDNRISGIERIDISGPMMTAIRIDHGTVLRLSDESNQLVIDSGFEDVVDLGSGWSILPGANQDYVTYDQGFARVLVKPQVGDSNRDGIFNSSDLISVLRAGEYEDDVADNSTFAEGDWNGDGDFDSTDFLIAFQQGNYVVTARPTDFRAIAAAMQTTGIGPSLESLGAAGETVSPDPTAENVEELFRDSSLSMGIYTGFDQKDLASGRIRREASIDREGAEPLALRWSRTRCLRNNEQCPSLACGRTSARGQ